MPITSKKQNCWRDCMLMPGHPPWPMRPRARAKYFFLSVMPSQQRSQRIDLGPINLWPKWDYYRPQSGPCQGRPAISHRPPCRISLIHPAYVTGTHPRALARLSCRLLFSETLAIKKRSNTRTRNPPKYPADTSRKLYIRHWAIKKPPALLTGGVGEETGSVFNRRWSP